jgi:hypothetical protein
LFGNFAGYLRATCDVFRDKLLVVTGQQEINEQCLGALGAAPLPVQLPESTLTSPVDAADLSPAISRRRLLRTMLGAGAVLGSVGGYATGIEPFWLQMHEVPLRVPGLPAALNGYRVAQVSDMHTGDLVPYYYLSRVIRQLNDAQPDLVLITGDMIHHERRFISPAVDLISQIRAPKVASLGNHDYAPFTSEPRHETILADELERELPRANCPLLRNSAMPWEARGARIWLVGLEDLWSRLFDPLAAFANAGPEPRLVLSHNPDTAADLVQFGAAAIFSGHTHGGQVRLPLIGAPILPVRDRRHDQGRFELTGPGGMTTTLYVSRGVGYLHQIRFMCRPEVPIFRLEAAPAASV